MALAPHNTVLSAVDVCKRFLMISNFINNQSKKEMRFDMFQCVESNDDV